MLKTLKLQHNFIIFLYSNHVHQCYSQFFKHHYAVTKTIIMSCINNVFSYYVLLGYTSECISIYITTDMQSNPTWPQQVVWVNVSWWTFTFVFGAVHFCDPITQEAFLKPSVNKILKRLVLYQLSALKKLKLQFVMFKSGSQYFLCSV